MISADFAPNEELNDAWISFKLLFQPWKWRKGEELNLVKKKILKKMLQTTNYKLQTFLFLTGRSALYHLLHSLDLSANDEVIVQGFTCEAVILPILANKLKPIYVDIETQTYSINPIELVKKITSKTRVVILQHTFGLTPAARSKVLSVIRRHNLVLIEDIAHGYSQDLLDALNRDQIPNHYLLMSFGRSKALSSVFGGAIVSSEIVITSKLQRIVNSLSSASLTFIARLLVYKPLSVLIKKTYDSGIGKMIHRIIQTSKLFIPEITQKEKGGIYDYLLDKAYPNGLAITLLNQLSNYEQVKQYRASICSLYQKKLVSSINPEFVRLKSNISLLRYPILVEDPNFILNKTSRKNIFLGSWYNQVVAPKSVPLPKMKYKIGECPKAEEICKRIINLPTNISHQEALKVVDLLNEYSRSK
ncbi:DegT/DnrJ/EryC1/StrS aminotransferase family protein [Candidatus Roizmanbacteria bacterium]|nr:DegT/DnrJ/EryC1/StrS aminotransferase family protein [Candidatus Roizmanbacteria bacterium]